MFPRPLQERNPLGATSPQADRAMSLLSCIDCLWVQDFVYGALFNLTSSPDLSHFLDMPAARLITAWSGWIGVT